MRFGMSACLMTAVFPQFSVYIYVLMSEGYQEDNDLYPELLYLHIFKNQIKEVNLLNQTWSTTFKLVIYTNEQNIINHKVCCCWTRELTSLFSEGWS